MTKSRLDNLIFQKQLAPSREKAKSLIIAGSVCVNGQKRRKPSDLFSDTDLIEIIQPPKFVSRAGEKLNKAIKCFRLALEGAVAADIGASTGGFTDCMLQYGAKKVYALDVGYGQLDWNIRNDSRVTVMERTNARYMEPEWFAEPLAFAAIDVSFISVKLILPPLRKCLNDAKVVVLIKPQFEAGRDQVGKKGVVRDKNTHVHVINSVAEFAAGIGYDVLGLDYSPIKGPEGNIEFLLLLGTCASPNTPIRLTPDAAAQAVMAAHEYLNRNPIDIV